MYKQLAMINGCLLAIMIFINALLSGAIGALHGTLIFHGLGLAGILLLLPLLNKKSGKWSSISWHAGLPGVFSVLVTLLNNLCVPKLGATLVVVLALTGQLVTSALVAHYGWMGMPQNVMRKEKWIGFGLIAMGVGTMAVL